MNLIIVIINLYLATGWCSNINKENPGGGLIEEEHERAQSMDKDQESAFLSDLIMVASTGDLFNPCPGHSTGLAGESFSELINTLIISECVLAAPCTYPRDVGGECHTSTVFDFIVVGGGSAGAVVAARLSERTNWNVLLLEAGGDPSMTSDVPYFFRSLQGTDMDWGYKTTRERGLYNGFMGKVNRWPAGKSLGGTSTMGSMLYIRGHRSDYDNLAAVGNVGWSYEDVLPLFKKSENVRDLGILNAPISVKYHSRGGPLSISRFGKKNPINDVIQNVTFDMGQPMNHDLNGISINGFVFPNIGTVHNGERVNTAKAFLNPMKRRQNLFVVKHAYVTKVLICHKTKRAYGVEYFYKNERKSRILHVSREVIVCAGTVESAKLLMLSGIGPYNDLTELGIYVQQNLRVGRNLHDNANFPIVPIALNFKANSWTPLDMLDYSYEYLTRRSGPFSSIGVSEIVGMLNVKREEMPDVRIQFTYMTKNDTDLLKDYVKNFAFEEDIALQLYNSHYVMDLLIGQVLLLKPKSRGVIRLKSTNPDDMPLIEARYFDHPDDLDTIMGGVRFLEQFAGHHFLNKYDVSLKYLNYTGCCGLEPGSDYYYACAISHVGGTGYNPSGSNKMGPCEDPDAVVDPQLRVHGIKGLRVADASILPNPITGSLMAAAIMIGEKVSNLIKLQWVSNYHQWYTTPSPWSNPTTLKIPKRETSIEPYQKRPLDIWST